MGALRHLPLTVSQGTEFDQDPSSRHAWYMSLTACVLEYMEGDSNIKLGQIPIISMAECHYSTIREYEAFALAE